MEDVKLSINIKLPQVTIYHFFNYMVYLSKLMEMHNMEFQSKFATFPSLLF